jgi:hypothetical protein
VLLAAAFAAAVPLIAGTAFAATMNPASRPAGPVDTSAVASGSVAGARYGADAVRAAGAAADRFRASRISTTTGQPKAFVGPAATLHNDWGLFPSYGPTGLTTTHTINPSVRLSRSGDVLYTPTMKPPTNSCIEVVTVYSTGTPQIWAWDWCGSVAPAVEVNIDQRFVATYGTTAQGPLSYTVRVERTNTAANRWTARLYNQVKKAWDTLFTSAGPDKAQAPYGWDIFEFYSATNPATGHTFVCDDIARTRMVLESQSISVKNGGRWTPATPANSFFNPARPNPADYLCPAVKFQVRHANNSWLVSE